MSETFVADASVAIAWSTESQASPATDLLLDGLYRGNLVIVPVLWRQEVSNALLMLLRRKKLTRREWLDGLELLDVLPVVVDNHAEKIALTSLAYLADETGLTVYDAAYLELARRKRIPLASRDIALNKACLAAGVEVMKLAAT